ncbi:hypothetical protein HYFRA_00002487 [Hymenoscyphus fraxineus]|uniref:RRN7-type domain-containing protein n=1 Tax=Hymenoscyphus fraxineus TaxID=746836 RepID=A0A9N9PNK8_9HELO|nr:hypothetical protein HYFRA_00002487 [Hymenoscyphus fraxineus]
MSQHIEYQRFRRGDSCTEEGCRSRKYYLENGRKFCQRGHEQAGFTQTQQDEDDWNTQGKKSRKQREQKERVERILSGQDAIDLYLQCYQLILWKQCNWLVNEKRFPSELETVVKDLWGLRVGKLFKAGEKSYGSVSGTFFSSASEAENTESDGKSVSSRRSRRSIAGEERMPKLIETLGLCYLGMLLMRLPTSLGDLFKWVTNEEMVYARATKEIPLEMRRKLPPPMVASFDIKAPLRGETLQTSVMQLVEFYKTQLNMIFPSINYPLVMYKHIRDLALPIEIYSGARRLSEMLEFDFSYPVSFTKNREASAYPELQIISAIVVATKLCYPFDDIARLPYSGSDPTAMKLDWTTWSEIMIQGPSKRLRRGEELKVTDKDVLKMSDGKIDDYLDWYQRTWIDDRDPKLPKQILDFFPLQDLPPRQPDDAESTDPINLLKKVQQHLIPIPHKSVGDGDKPGIRRPGEFYKRYRSPEELPDTAKAFFELAAQSAGTSVDMLVKSVFQVEVRLERWHRNERRNRAQGGRDEDSSSEDY